MVVWVGSSEVIAPFVVNENTQYRTCEDTILFKWMSVKLLIQLYQTERQVCTLEALPDAAVHLQQDQSDDRVKYIGGPHASRAPEADGHCKAHGDWSSS